MSITDDSQQGDKKGKKLSDLQDALMNVTSIIDLTATSMSSDEDENTVEDKDEDDEDLFKPPPPKEECPLCLDPFPNEGKHVTYSSCCGKRICSGCMLKHVAVLWWTNRKRAAKDPPEPPIEVACAFCRADACNDEKIQLQRLHKRMALNDPNAFNYMTSYYTKGDCGSPTDQVELLLRAVELGSADACFNVALEYAKGGSLGQDHSKYTKYIKIAAKRGHAQARHNLGVEEHNLGNFELAVKHFMISAAAGIDNSLKCIGVSYRAKQATKEQFEEALRAHQKAKKEMSSDERKMAKKVEDAGGNSLSVLSESELATLCGVRKTELGLFRKLRGTLA